GLAAADVLGRHDRFEEAREAQGLERRLDVPERRGRGQGLAPAGALQAVEPGPRAWKQVDAALAHERALAPLLAVADPLDLGGREVVAEQAPEDGVVALAERIGELSGGEVVRGRSHRLAPGDPVQRRGIDERAVEVPEHAAGNVVARLGVALLR